MARIDSYLHSSEDLSLQSLQWGNTSSQLESQSSAESQSQKPWEPIR